MSKKRRLAYKAESAKTLTYEPLHPDVMVLGTGRSGTSFVAGVLHNHFKVCMGHDFINVTRKVDGREGSYECGFMWEATVAITGKWDPGYKDADTDLWLRWFRRVHENCETPLRGVKVTHLSRLTPRQLIAIKPRLVIRTWRYPTDSAKSFNRLEHRNNDDWEVRCNGREDNLVKLQLDTTGVTDFLWVCIPNRKHSSLTEEDLITYLTPYIARLKGA